MKVPSYKPYDIDAKKKVFDSEFRIVKSKLKNSRVCIDIGAHVGIYAREYSKYFSEVHSFEPIPSLYKMLEENVNDVDSVHTHNVAVSNKDSTISIYENPYNSEINVVESLETAELTNRLFGPSGKWDVTAQKVPSRTIDSYGLSNVDLIKVDTEGYTLHVITGMIETLKKNSPVLQVEKPNLQTSILLSDNNYIEFNRTGEDVYYYKV